MRSLRPPLWLAWLAACTPPAAEPTRPPPPAALQLRPTAWGPVASARLSASQRQPQAADRGWRLWSRGVQAVASEDGVHLQPRSGGGAVVLRVRAWGSPDDPRPVHPVALRPGACTDETDARGACLRRLEYDHDGLVAWWRNGPAGLQQGFEVAPTGAGLVIDLQVDAEVELMGPNEALWSTADSALRYAGLTAWDARGVELPARLELVDDVLRLHVDDRDAVGPITVDPLVGDDATWSIDPTDQDQADFGSAAAIDDFNGDGFDDAVITSPIYDAEANEEGRAWLFLGSPAGLQSVVSWTADPADQDFAHFGQAVASAGDVNGDGMADLLVAATGFDAEASSEGRVYLYLGAPGGLSPGPGWSWDLLDQANGSFGMSLAHGDVNGDGYSDVALGAERYDGAEYDQGRAMVILGSAAGPASGPVWDRSPVDEPQAAYGAGLAMADLDGDGFDDLVVGSSSAGAGGEVHIHPGSAEGPSATPSVTLTPDGAAGATFGAEVVAGDVNGDGYVDIVVGAPNHTNPGGQPGRAWLYLGSAAGISSQEAWTANADRTSYNTFSSTLAAGDLDGDGRADVAVGCPQGANRLERAGLVHVYAGATGGLSTTDLELRLPDPVAFDVFGSSLATGDVNGDGYADLLVGADGRSGEATAEGQAWLYMGCANTPEVAGNEQDEDCDGLIACYADADGDGFSAPAAQVVLSADPRCDAPGEALWVSAAPDCHDGDPAVNPGAVEQPGDARDEDCDGTVACYVDRDGDGYIGAAAVPSADADCTDPQEQAAPGTPADCDDDDANARPGGVEVAGNEADEDCDGVVRCYVDLDGDGATPGRAVIDSIDADCADRGEAQVASAEPDCDDADDARSPALSEDPARSLDEDCDGLVACSVDADDDGYGAGPASTAPTCPRGQTAASLGDDCDDGDRSTHPGASEIAGDEVDNDCVGGDEGSPGGGGCAQGGGHAGWSLGLLAVLFLRRVRS